MTTAEMIVDSFAGGGGASLGIERAQGFPDTYILPGSKARQVAAIGNSVCPIMAEVLVRANLTDQAEVAA